MNGVGDTSPGRRDRAALVDAVAPLVGAGALLGLWEGLVRLFDVPAYQLIRPTAAMATVVRDPAYFWDQARPTIAEALLGLSIAVAISLVVGALAAESPFLERAIGPLVTFLQVTPIVAYAPTLVILVGFGLRTIVIVVVIVCLAPLLGATVTGLRTVDQGALDVMRSVRATRRQVLWRLRLPAALPAILAAVRVGVGLSLIGAVLGEWSAVVSDGLGVRLRVVGDLTFRDRFWGIVFVLALIGLVGVGLVRVLERVLLRGRPTAR